MERLLTEMALIRVPLKVAFLRGVYSGKVYKRAVEYHIKTSLALLMMRFDHPLTALAAKENIPRAKCSAFRETLHERSPDGGLHQRAWLE